MVACADSCGLCRRLFPSSGSCGTRPAFVSAARMASGDALGDRRRMHGVGGRRGNRCARRGRGLCGEDGRLRAPRGALLGKGDRGGGPGPRASADPQVTGGEAVSGSLRQGVCRSPGRSSKRGRSSFSSRLPRSGSCGLPGSSVSRFRWSPSEARPLGGPGLIQFIAAAA